MTPQQRMDAALKAYQAHLNKDGDWSAEDEAESVKLKATLDAAQADVQREVNRRSAQGGVSQYDAFLNQAAPGTEVRTAANPATNSGGNGETRADVQEEKRVVAQVRRGSLKNFKGTDAAVRAYLAGQFFRATLVGSLEARAWCQRNGVELRTQRESVNSAGGYLVPVQIDNEIIDLKEEYGVIRRLAKGKQMTSDTLLVNRREGGLIAYAVGEGQKIPTSEKKWGQIELKAKKFAVIAKMTNEFDSDAVIAAADDLIGEMAYAFAQKEDDCAFNGTGTSFYHGITGIGPKLKDLNADPAKIAGLEVALVNSWAEITDAQLLGVIGRTPTYAMKRSPFWMVTNQFYTSVMLRLARASGGTTAAEMVNGQPQFTYGGYRVELVETMPSNYATGDIPALFGVPELGIMFGDRQQTTIAMTADATVDGESTFETDQSAIRATERIDISVHDVGNADADATKRVAGPITGLLTLAD